MRVALYISEQAPTVGGGYTFEMQILKGLLDLVTKSRHQFFLYTRNSSLSRTQIPKLVQFIPLYSQMNGNESAWDEIKILASLKNHGIDLVLALAPRHLTMEIPYIPIIWDIQHRLQPYFPEVSQNGEWQAREAFFSQLLSRASIIITGTEIGKSEIERSYNIPAARIKVIPFPTPQFVLNSSPINQTIFKKYHINSPYLFYPAQFWPHKNHVGTLLALKILKEKFNAPFSLVFTGSDHGNQAFVQEQAQRLALGNQVRFLGFIPQEDMIPLYQNAFALVFMTFFGPDNLPPLEAMALGCPVIASNVPGAEEQLGNAALLVDPLSPEKIADAVVALWRNESLRQAYIEKGRRRAQRWTTPDYVQSLFAILDNFEAIRRCWP